jgi:hypothetical protein
MDTIDSRWGREPAEPVPRDALCPRCNSPMAIHQPDPELVDRYLATCDECRLWVVRNSKEDVIVLLPEILDEDHECEAES